VDDLGGRVPVRRPVHLVLHRSEELLRQLGVGLVVDARRVDVEDLLVEPPWRARFVLSVYLLQVPPTRGWIPT
jgi:hypothetical protein